MTKSKGDALWAELEGLDRTIFRLDAEQARQFVESLANPTAPNEQLRQAVAKRAPWEAQERPACDE